MDKVKGFKTMAVNVVVTLVGLAAYFGISAPAGAEVQACADTVSGLFLAGAGLANMALRFFTTSPVFSK